MNILKDIIERQNVNDTDLITEQTYWTTDEIKNGKNLVFDERVPKQIYDGHTYQLYNERNELLDKIEELKQTIRTISKYFN